MLKRKLHKIVNYAVKKVYKIGHKRQERQKAIFSCQKLNFDPSSSSSSLAAIL
jgi:hypothetical protein